MVAGGATETGARALATGGLLGQRQGAIEREEGHTTLCTQLHGRAPSLEAVHLWSAQQQGLGSGPGVRPASRRVLQVPCSARDTPRSEGQHIKYWIGVYSALVTEQTDLIARLEESRVLDGVRWAYGSAVARTLTDYSEDAGHDAAWLGNTRFVLFRDRLDRIFSCGRYALQAGDDASTGLDLVRVELTEKDIATMPTVTPDLVRRADLNHSPGWVVDDMRFLLASCAFGKIDSLPWPRKSTTKQTVAKQANPEPPPTLFDDIAPDEVGGLEALRDEVLDVDTFVVAHTLDAVGQRRELVLGRPQINHGGGNAWHWYENLLAGPPLVGGRQDAPRPAGPDTVPDAPVRLRKHDDQRKTVEGQR